MQSNSSIAQHYFSLINWVSVSDCVQSRVFFVHYVRQLVHTLWPAGQLPQLVTWIEYHYCHYQHSIVHQPIRLRPACTGIWLFVTFDASEWWQHSSDSSPASQHLTNYHQPINLRTSSTSPLVSVQIFTSLSVPDSQPIPKCLSNSQCLFNSSPVSRCLSDFQPVLNSCQTFNQLFSVSVTAHQLFIQPSNKIHASLNFIEMESWGTYIS